MEIKKILNEDSGKEELFVFSSNEKIGKLSEKAIWVKEGDVIDTDIKIVDDVYVSCSSSRLDENDIKRISQREKRKVLKVETEYGDRDEHSKTIYTMIYWENPVVKVKCNNCQIFH